MRMSLSGYAWAPINCGTTVKIDVAATAESTGLDDVLNESLVEFWDL